MPRLRIALTVLGFLGLGLGLIGSHRALAYLSAEIASLNADRAAAQRAGINVQDAAVRALQLRPKEYRYLEQAARAEERLRRPQHALRYWRAAVEQRPSWPYAWAGLSRWHLRYGDDALALERALEASARVGDNERGLQKFFATLALEYADRDLTSLARHFLDQRLEREIRAQPTHILGYALVRHQETALCRAWARTGPENYWCAAARYARRRCDWSPSLSREAREWCDNLQRIWRSFDYPAR